MADLTVHRLKCLPAFYEAIVKGYKPFECRRDDRTPRFEIGHILILCEYDRGKGYTKREIAKRVTYVLRGSDPAPFGIMEGYCVMGLSDDV